jgi:diadenosine tetraphosphatase ApaH/serine/threonine PP2A family protein phosphatase
MAREQAGRELMTDRTIFIGDLHGCYDETVALLEQLQPTPNDWLIFLGDYVDRGPENAKCCDLVRDREQVQGKVAGILGNHEDRHLQYEDEIARKGHANVVIPTHIATRKQLSPAHYEWFRSLPLFVRVPEHNAVAVHAGAFPGRTIEQQDRHHLLHLQMIKLWDFDEAGNMKLNTKSIWPSKADASWRFWTHFWDGPEVIIFGHSVLDKPLITDKCIGIDGGAVFGRQLHAYVLPEQRIVTINAAQDYGQGRRGTSGIKCFPIHGDVGTYS